MQFEPINVLFKICPSTPFLELHLFEQDESYADFLAWYKDKNSYQHIRMKFIRCISGKMCGIGGEAESAKLSIGIIKDSQWLKEINEKQLKYYPNYPDNFINVKHYFIKGHDVNFEVLAEGYNIIEQGEEFQYNS